MTFHLDEWILQKDPNDLEKIHATLKPGPLSTL